jgi:hypothetical protein
VSNVYIELEQTIGNQRRGRQSSVDFVTLIILLYSVLFTTTTDRAMATIETNTEDHDQDDDRDVDLTVTSIARVTATIREEENDDNRYEVEIGGAGGGAYFRFVGTDTAASPYHPYRQHRHRLRQLFTDPNPAEIAAAAGGAQLNTQAETAVTSSSRVRSRSGNSPRRNRKPDDATAAIIDAALDVLQMEPTTATMTSTTVDRAVDSDNQNADGDGDDSEEQHGLIHRSGRSAETNEKGEEADQTRP